jgi:hypothetical protein
MTMNKVTGGRSRRLYRGVRRLVGAVRPERHA